MQPATIHDEGHQTPDRTPPARMPMRSGLAGALLRAAVVGALAFAGWLALSALAGPQAAADPRGGLGDTAQNLGGPVEELDGIARQALGSTGPAPRAAGQGRRSSPDAVTDLVSTVSERDGARRLKASKPTGASASADGTALLRKAGLAKAASADRLLSALTIPDANSLLEAAMQASSPTEDAATSAPAPAEGSAGRGTSDPDLLRSGAPTSSRCDACTGHGPSAPRPDLPTSQDDLSGVFSQAGQAPGPMAGTLTPLIDTAPPVRGVRTLPATVLKDDSSPARPLVVPD